MEEMEEKVKEAEGNTEKQKRKIIKLNDKEERKNST